MDVLKLQKRVHRWFESRRHLGLAAIDRKDQNAPMVAVPQQVCGPETTDHVIITYMVARSECVGTHCTYRDLPTLTDAELDGAEPGRHDQHYSGQHD
jgi:hypothetical protein